jgi:hypothetical protein
MIEKIQTVRNPLTIIAIFAAITEVSGTVVLPFVDHPNQLIFIYFLISFPILLVSLFFFTLNFNYKLLYAPSDFRDERFFIDLIKPASPSDINKKIDIETKDLQAQEESGSNEKPKPAPDVAEQAEAGQGQAGDIRRSTSYPDLRKRYIIGEQLVLNRIALEESVTIKRNVKLMDQAGKYPWYSTVTTKEVTALLS